MEVVYNGTLLGARLGVRLPENWEEMDVQEVHSVMKSQCRKLMVSCSWSFIVPFAVADPYAHIVVRISVVVLP